MARPGAAAFAAARRSPGAAGWVKRASAFAYRDFGVVCKEEGGPGVASDESRRKQFGSTSSPFALPLPLPPCE